MAVNRKGVRTEGTGSGRQCGHTSNVLDKQRRWHCGDTAALHQMQSALYAFVVLIQIPPSRKAFP